MFALVFSPDIVFAGFVQGLVFALVATSTALVPLVAYLVRGDRALGTLGRAKDWLTKRSDVVMSAIMVVFGILLVWKGWGAL